VASHFVNDSQKIVCERVEEANITLNEDIDICVRCGGPKSGHSFLNGGAFRFAIKQGYLPKGTSNPVSCTETSVIPDFDGRAYSLRKSH